MRRAVTLTEVLIIVVIAGILAGVAIPKYISIMEKNRNREAIAVLESIAAAEIRYYNKYDNFYPTARGAIRETEIGAEPLSVLFAHEDWDYCVARTVAGRLFIFARRASGTRRYLRMEVNKQGPPSGPESWSGWNAMCGN